MSFNVMKIDQLYDQKDFIDECLRLGIEDSYIVELILASYANGEDKTGQLSANLQVEIADRKKVVLTLKVEEPKPVEKKDGEKTIHSVIMTGLRAGDDNNKIRLDLALAFPEVLGSKLKQRVYEYRYHFNKGKIK